MSAATGQLPRGVYALDFRDPHGHELMVVVDRRGNMVGPLTRVFPRDDRGAVILMLRRLLDQEDPLPPP